MGPRDHQGSQMDQARGTKMGPQQVLGIAMGFPLQGGPGTRPGNHNGSLDHSKVWDCNGAQAPQGGQGATMGFGDPNRALDHNGPRGHNWAQGQQGSHGIARGPGDHNGA